MNKYITIDELNKSLKMSTSTINRHLKTLTTINAITRVGSEKTAIGKLIFKYHYIFLKPTSSFVPFKNMKFQNKIFS